MIADTVEHTNILGVRVSAVNLDSALATIEQWIGKREHRYVCATTVHGLLESQRDAELRRIHNQAGLVMPDGMPLVWISRLKGQRRVERVCGPDLLPALSRRSEQRGYRQFFYGGTPQVAKMLVDRLRDAHPDLQIAGIYAPPFRRLTTEEDAAVVALINASQADIVWVGLGAPKQERWMAEHLGRLDAPVMIGVGAAFDFHAGVKRRAPRWMQRSGLEWTFRLASEPRRLWRRYLVGNPKFVWLVLQQMLLRRDRSSPEA